MEELGDNAWQVQLFRVNHRTKKTSWLQLQAFDGKLTAELYDDDVTVRDFFRAIDGHDVAVVLA